MISDTETEGDFYRRIGHAIMTQKRLLSYSFH